MKYKVGDKVRVKENAREVTEEKYGWDSMMDEMVGVVCEVKEVIYDSRRGRYKVRVWTPDKSGWFSFPEEALEPATKTWQDLQKGDVVLWEGHEQTVLARVGDLIALSGMNAANEFAEWLTIQEMEEDAERCIEECKQDWLNLLGVGE